MINKIMMLGILTVGIVISAKNNPQIEACEGKPDGAGCMFASSGINGTSTSYGTCKTICNNSCTLLCSLK